MLHSFQKLLAPHGVRIEIFEIIDLLFTKQKLIEREKERVRIRVRIM